MKNLSLFFSWKDYKFANSLKKTLLLSLLTLNSFLMYAAVPPPVVTRVPNTDTVCVGSILTVTLSGATAGCSYLQEYIVPGGASTWQSLAIGASISPNVPGIARIRAKITCTGGPSDTSLWVEKSWVVVNKPTMPTAITKIPDSELCIGAVATAIATGSTGGTGSSYYKYSFFHYGRAEGAYSTTNTYTADTVSTLYVRAIYYSDGYGCGESGDYNTSWTIVPDPKAPILVKSPNLDSVCIGAVVTIDNPSLNTGGTGACENRFRYYNGTSWSLWSTIIPSVSVSTPGQIVKIQGLKVCDGPGCNPSDTNEVTWKGIADPIWGSVSLSEDSLCVGGSVSLNGSFSGGSGGRVLWFRYTTTPTYTWTSPPNPNTINTAGTYYYYPKYEPIPSNSGCNLDSGVSHKLVVVSDPAWTGVTVAPTSDCLGAQIVLSASLTGGLSGASIIWYRDTISTATGNIVTSPDVPTVADVYYYRQRYNAGANPRGCNRADGPWRTVTLNPLPIAKTITGNPVAGSTVCLGASISATFSGGVDYLSSDQYQYSIDGGATWTTYTPGSAIVTTLVGTNFFQIRTRKLGSGTTVCTSDWTTAQWTVSAGLVPPSLNIKTPNITAVCAGTSVNATITAGSGGVGCSDTYEFSINNGTTWNTYTSGQIINTATATEVIIRGWRGNCDVSSGCANSAIIEIARWTVHASVTAAVLTPTGGEVCSGNTVSATVVTSGSGGTGCSDVFQSRYRSSGVWSAWISYTPGNALATTGRDSIQIRTTRSCDPLSGCAASNLYSWVINNYTVVSPTLTKTPNIATICQGTNASATLLTAGSGGNGCSNYYEYRTNNGTWGSWASYTLGSSITTVGLSGVEIRTWRANCLPGGICGDSTINTYSWSIVAAPIQPTITRYPTTAIICNSDTVRGTISWGSGGSGCVNFAQYRIKTGTTWSTWYAYTSGQNILASGRTEVEIKAWIGNCSAISGCLASDTARESWIVSSNLVNPTLNRLPNRTSICQEEFASATLFTAGSGGVNCSDVFEYRKYNGSWSTWASYTLGSNVSGIGVSLIEIRGFRGNCDAGASCNAPAPFVLSWTVVPTATPPVITRIPNQDEVCSGTSVSATITAGTGGISCFDYRQYRYFNGTSWSTWISYTSGNSISTTGRTIVQVRAFRGCQPTTGCLSTDTALVQWTVVSGIIQPVLSKNPNLDTICQGTSVLASLSSAGSGGVGCSDIYEYRINISGVWGSWNNYTPSMIINTDLSTQGVQIRANRTNCTSGITCGSSTGNTYTWVVVPLPIAPGITRIPNTDFLCSGQTASVSTTPGSGYSCSDYFQYRRYNGITWSAWAFYPNGYNISSSGYQTIEVRGFNRNCNLTSGCTPDTNYVSWTVSTPIIAPTLAKTPNVTSVCQGQTVSATLSGGSGGIDCLNMSEYTIDGGATWFAYISGSTINTFGVSTVSIRAFRDNCNPSVPCPSSDTVTVSWTVSVQPIAPVVNRIPDVDVVCLGSSVSANITVGSGGVSCADIYKYRYHNGTTWSAWATYPIGYNISTTSRTQIEIMGYRTCTGTGCTNTDTSLVHWDVDPTIVNPTLTKHPNLASVCDGTDVWATLATAGSGGSSCSDVFESSTDGGVSWSPYVPGVLINTASLTSVRIRAYRGNCASGGCIPTDTNSIVWNVSTGPTEPVITKNPNQNDVCYGTLISASIISGTGGTGCANYSQYRINNGLTWTTWYNYTSGNNIVYPTNAQIVQVRAFRGNCTGGCGSSDTISASWNIIQSLINPILAKSPNTTTVIENSTVSATVLVSGGNGIGCQDVLQYRINNGSGYGPWDIYTAGNPISTTGSISIQVRGFRGLCSGGDLCPPPDTTLYTWSVVQGPQAPNITRIPNVDDLCFGTLISASISPNGGGVGCADYSQYRTYNGTTWATWITYTSGNNISYPAGTTQVQVRAFRGNCDPASGDLSSDTTLVSWNLFPTMVNPILLKNPNVIAVCAGIDVFATIQTVGTGGSSCSDLLEYRVNNGTGFNAWQSYIAGDPIPTTGYTAIQVRGFRGGCLSGPLCPPADTNIYAWNISVEPIAPVVVRNPNQDDVCRGTALSATITPGSGGSGCTEYYQSRQYNGTTWTAWSAYTSGSNIGYGLLITKVQVRAFRGNCSLASGCISSDTTTVAWNILPSLTRPLITKTPQLAAICEGVNVSALVTTPGSGGVGCIDVMEYRTNNGSGFGAWSSYVGATPISTLGLTSVQIRANHESCTSGDECPATDTIVSWTITSGPIAPQLTRIPNLNEVCRNTAISATVVPGSGGDGCSDIAEYRLYNGTTWTSWIAYATSTNISYFANTDQVQLRAYRSYCDVGTGCTSSDTNMVSWVITDNLANPVLLKHPNIDSICSGINVSASVQTPGSGGTGCSDILEYRVNSGSGFSAWFAYGENDLIPTAGYTQVQIRGFVGNCTSGNQCPPIDTLIYSWVVNPGLIAPIIVRNPNQDAVCRGTAISAIITPGSGGNSCSEYYQYRLFNGSTWTAWGTYTSGNPVLYNPSDVSVQIRVYRGNCNVASGCATSDTTLVSWNIQNYLINPILEKTPNIASVCNVSEVSAAINIPGSGGTGCSDFLQYRTNSGSGLSAWQTYTSSDPIPTTGYTEIQVRGYIGNCTSGSECPPADTTIYSWTIQSEPVAPIITKVPNVANVCFGNAISAIITPGSGGTGCVETAQYRRFNGSIWGAWTAYTSGSSIPLIAGTTSVEVRAFRGNCNPLSGCPSSDTTIANWNILNTLVNPILTKIPNVATVCQGTDVSATIQTPGSGGVGCSDLLQYRINNGLGFGAWFSYNPGDPLPTFGSVGVQVRGFIGNCTSGSECPPVDTTIYSWSVTPQPTAPSIVRIPNTDTICRGTAISATITAGTGGNGCTDTYQIRNYNGATWSAWALYTSGSNIVYGATITQVQVRAFRGGCTSLTGCLNSDTTIVNWVISNQPINPVLAKNPNIATVCDGTMVSATVSTPGSGGSGCSDIFGYRTYNGTIWSTWTNYTPGTQIVTTGITRVQIIGQRANCNLSSSCTPPAADTVSWLITPQPTEPTLTRIPNLDNICRGTAIAATVTPGIGGTACTNYAQYRSYNGATWTAWASYTSGNNIVYGPTTTRVEVRAFRGNCDITSGCLASDTVLVGWDISSQPIGPVLAKVPNVTVICQGIDAQATLTTPGSGGIGCSDVIQYRTNNGIVFSAWAPYAPASLISTTGLTQVEIRSYSGGCTVNICDSVISTLSWIVVPPIVEPILTKTPNVTSLCQGAALSATVTPGSGGSSCSDIVQYRTNNGTTWTGWLSYISGSNINTSGLSNVEVRAFRGNCLANSLCLASDTVSVSWLITPQPIAPVLAKVPNILSVCAGTNLSATLTTAGSGGSGCSDVIQYRTDNGGGFGIWQNYTPPTAISTTGLVAVQIISYRGNCDVTSLCAQTAVDTIKWTVTPQPIAPLIARTPNTDTLCFGTAISATITAGTGGSGCADTYQSRIYNGSTWSAWSAYVSGANIVYGATVTNVEVRGFRGGCTALSGCINSDTTIVRWVISNMPVNPILSKTPNVATVCDGVMVSAAITTPGSGGIGCMDDLKYRTFNGTIWTSWTNYVSGTQIVTTGVTRVQVIGQRANCSLGGCTPPVADTISWLVTPQPTEPVITRVPDVNSLCFGTAISATIAPGIGGSACTNYSQYRTFNGTTWSAWAAYASASNIVYGPTINQIEVRAFRGNCDLTSGCLASDTVSVSWLITPQPIAPVLAKVPNIL
ncbi:MAG: hypothetical protein WCP69_03795, partial [Bacteroidota bacterium]